MDLNTIYDKKNAEKCLRKLRRGYAYPLQSYYLKQLRDGVRACGVSFEELNTNEEELLRLEKVGYTISALDIINTLRCGSNFGEQNLTLLKNFMEAGELTYADLNTTEEQVRFFSTEIE
jgi:hypothetical protein